MSLVGTKSGMQLNGATGLKQAVVAVAREISYNFASGYTSTPERGVPTFATAIAEHAERVDAVAYYGGAAVALLKSHGLPDGNFMRDMQLEDVGVVHMLNTGKELRKPEMKDNYRDLSSIFPDVRPWDGPASAVAEGGDLLFAGRQPLVVMHKGNYHIDYQSGYHDTYLAGVSGRTNVQGIEHITASINQARAEKGIAPLQMVPVPVQNVLHLETGFTIVKALPGDTLALQDPALGELPPFIHTLFNVQMMPADQGYGASVLVVNGTVFTAVSCPAAWSIVHYYAPELNPDRMVTDQTAKMDGSLPCDFLLSSAPLKENFVAQLKIVSR